MQFLNAVDPELRLKLGVEVESDLTHGLFASQLSSKVDTQIQQLQALSEHTVNDSSIASLEEEESTVETLDEHSRGLGQFEAGIEYLREQLAAKQKADEANAYAVKSPYETCDLAACPMKLANRSAPESDPARQDIIESLLHEIHERVTVLANRIHERDQLQAAKDDLRRRLRTERRRVEKELSGIERAIGRWESYGDDVKHRRVASTKIDWCDGELKRLASAVKGSGNRTARPESSFEFDVEPICKNFGRDLRCSFGRKVEIDSLWSRAGCRRKTCSERSSFIGHGTSTVV